ncbi:MAG: hypothetical protein AAGD07_00675 [Planctomycetota bacterium]
MLAFIALTMILEGCQTPARVHVWERPLIQGDPQAATDRLQPRVSHPTGHQPNQNAVVLVGIRGPASMTRPLEEELLASANQRAGQDSLRVDVAKQLSAVQLISNRQLMAGGDIRLVSTFDQVPSDMAIAAEARRQGHRYLLSGEVIQPRGAARRVTGAPQNIALTWRLTDLRAGKSIHAKPISVPLPAKASQESDITGGTQVANEELQDSLDFATRQSLVRETLRLLWPSVALHAVKLAKPAVLPGSRGVRRGNRAAQRGDWSAAERAYLDVITAHPRNSAAWINASIAAVAREDFTEAKRRITEAIGFTILSPLNRTLAEETLVWIEIHQRQARDAFGLPDPLGGYRVLVPGDRQVTSQTHQVDASGTAPQSG